MTSWVPNDSDTGFSLQNLPYGVFSAPGRDHHIGVAIGSFALDLNFLATEGVFGDHLETKFDISTLLEPTLNSYAALGKSAHREVRALLQELLKQDTSLGDVLRDNQQRREKALVPLAEVQMHLPMRIGDYTDFFVGPYHAKNCVDIVRPGGSVSPNFFRFPLGYHGRASTVVISDTPVRRPKGQFPDGKSSTTFGPSQKLDFEVELAAFVAVGNDHGSPIDINKAEEHIFGVVLMNDWSSRDIQFTESTPLGPFNGKNFCTTISPWIVPLEALEPYRTAPVNSESLLPYLAYREDSVYDIPIDVHLQVKSEPGETFHAVRCNTKFVAFSLAQMLAHHTAGGCSMRTGDLFATGTLSGPTRPEVGCLLEASWNGTQPYELTSVSSPEKKVTRRFLEDGDVVSFTAQAARDGVGRIEFGVCRGEIVPVHLSSL